MHDANQADLEAISPTICLVDDDPMIRELFSRVIKRSGCQVLVAFDAADAESVLAGGQVDILLSDLNMPDATDGEQLLKSVKTTYPNLPVCMMSADWPPAAREKMLEQGASACLAKPFSTDDFTQLIASLEW